MVRLARPFFGFVVAMSFLGSPTWADSTSERAADVVAPPADNGGDRALWEVGLAAAGAQMPDYPAAAQKHPKWIIAPYGVYRGRIVRADKDGARARIIQTKMYEVDMSLAASFASRSKDNDARQGMPDLDYLFEIGPRMTMGLSHLGGRGRLLLFAPVRAVFSTDLGDFQHRGYSATPALHARWFVSRRAKIMGIVQLTSTFGNRQLNAYFYDVAPGLARSGRAFYDARGGYMGSDLFVGALIPVKKRYRFFVGGQLLEHSGSANEASPLFKNHVNYSVATGLVYTIWYSQKTAASME